jgi:hypothetical protein
MRAASAVPTGILAEPVNFGGPVKQAVALLVNLVVNVVANLVTLLICPFLVVAWIVRVRALESRARRSARSTPAGAAPRRSDLRLAAIAGGGK